MLLQSGLASWWSSGSPHSDPEVRNDSEEPKRQTCWAASGQPVWGARATAPLRSDAKVPLRSVRHERYYMQCMLFA